MKEQDQFNKIDKMGNILENGKKVDTLSIGDGVDITLKDHIFATSFSNIIIDEEYVEDEIDEATELEIQLLIDKIDSIKNSNIQGDSEEKIKLQKTMLKAKDILALERPTSQEVNKTLKELDEILSRLVIQTIGEKMWIVPLSGIYEIGVKGGSGGRGGNWLNGYGGGRDGKPGLPGDMLVGEFTLKTGDVLYTKIGNNGRTGHNAVQDKPGGGYGGEASYVIMVRDNKETIIISAKGGNGGIGGYDTPGHLGIGKNINLGENKSKPFRSLGSNVYIFRDALQ